MIRRVGILGGGPAGLYLGLLRQLAEVDEQSHRAIRAAVHVIPGQTATC